MVHLGCYPGSRGGGVLQYTLALLTGFLRVQSV